MAQQQAAARARTGSAGSAGSGNRSFSLRGARLGDKYEQLMAAHGDKFVIRVPAGAGIATITPTARIDLAAAFAPRSGTARDAVMRDEAASDGAVRDEADTDAARDGAASRELAHSASGDSSSITPLIIEVGPGSGEQLVASALRHPDWHYLGLEAWAPGVARSVKNLLAAGVSNVRLMELDAAQALPVLFNVPARELAGELGQRGEQEPRDALAPAGAGNPPAAEVWTFFPDPWRKRRHRKRRIVSPQFAHTVASVLAPGGVWRLATDWANYAWQMRDVLAESPWFDNPYEGQHVRPEDEGLYASRGGFAPRWEERVITRFEERGREAGRAVYDLVAVRNDVPLAAVAVPEDPWIAAEARGEFVPAARPGVTPAPSSRAGWLKAQQAQQVRQAEQIQQAEQTQQASHE